MKPYFIFITLFIFSCNNNDNAKTSIDKFDSSIISNKDTIPTDTLKSMIIGTALYVWSVDIENKTKKRNPYLKTSYLNVDSLIKGFNITYPGIELEKIKFSGDTLFTKINDSRYLTDEIGSSGADLYISTVVLNLTAIKAIKHVKIDFKEGSHASPDVWTKEDFNYYKEIH